MIRSVTAAAVASTTALSSMGALPTRWSAAQIESSPTAVRESAVAIELVLGLLYVFPVVTSVVSNQHWQRHLEQIGPMTALPYIQATANLSSLPLTPWQGLGVLALWAAGALTTGALIFRFRDA